MLICKSVVAHVVSKLWKGMDCPCIRSLVPYCLGQGTLQAYIRSASPYRHEQGTLPPFNMQSFAFICHCEPLAVGERSEPLRIGSAAIHAFFLYTVQLSATSSFGAVQTGLLRYFASLVPRNDFVCHRRLSQMQGTLPQAYMQSFIFLCHHEKKRCKTCVQQLSAEAMLCLFSILGGMDCHQDSVRPYAMNCAGSLI